MNAPGAPKRDEMVIVAILTNRGRSTTRAPGLKKKLVSSMDKDD